MLHHSKLLLTILTLSLLFFTISCRDEKPPKVVEVVAVAKPISKIGKVVFYLENSESMFGYVKGFTEYVDVVSELSEKPEFAEQETRREFNFINGGAQLIITPLGNNPAIFKTKLNTAGFNCGDITKSNLNSMFQMALEKAQNDTISILISDAIYDIGKPQSPLSALSTVGKETRTKFIERLSKGDLQTLMIKLNSNFDGYYFYSSKNGKERLNQNRPFYIWIFGKSELLNNYFSEEYITKNLKGFDNYARFLNINQNAIPHQVLPSVNRKGNFKPDRNNKHTLIDVEQDRNGNGFQFALAVDFSSLPYADSYLTSIGNYNCNLNYKVMRIEKIKDNQKYGVTSFETPTHIITIHTNRSPFGKLNIVLKNEIPNWINETQIDNELNIDSVHTFGFNFLSDAISGAYGYKNEGKNLANFNIEILK